MSSDISSQLWDFLEEREGVGSGVMCYNGSVLGHLYGETKQFF